MEIHSYDRQLPIRNTHVMRPIMKPKIPLTLADSCLFAWAGLPALPPVLVNNRKVATRILEPGDVINIGGTLTVFDEGLGGAD